MKAKVYENKWVYDIPNDVRNIISKLYLNGFQAFLIGGCIRNSILKIEVKDWDITTNATPEEVERLFEHSIPTGKQFGVITVVTKEDSYEVATFRSDGFSNGRKPEEVYYSNTLEEDVSRRDFTINQLALDLQKNQIIDYYGGMDDIRRKVVRSIGDPDKRLKEDFLRMLRAIRFAAQLNFKIHKTLLISIKNNCKNINNISKERIGGEFRKIIESNPLYLHDLRDTGIMDEIILGKNDINSDYYNKIINSLVFYRNNAASPNLYGYLALLLYPIRKELNKSFGEIIKSNLRYDNLICKNTSKLINMMGNEIEPDRVSVKQQLSYLGKDLMGELYILKMCSIMAYSVDENNAKEEIGKLTESLEIYNSVLKNKEPYMKKDLALNGNDLLELGFAGILIGEMLEKCMSFVLKYPDKNNKDNLIGFIQTMI